MPSFFEIPLRPGQPQSMTIALANVTYALKLTWFDASNFWLMDIMDISGNVLIAGVPLVTGANLLAQYASVGIIGELWVATDGAPDALPTFSNLGSTSHLYYIER